MLDSIPSRKSSVILMKTPIQRAPIQPEVETSPQVEPFPNEPASSTPAPSSSASPYEVNPTGTNPETSEAKPDNEIQRGGYPDSKLWEREIPDPMTQPGSSSSHASFLTKDELFTEEFLHENPMVEKGNPGNSLRKISQNGGLDVIPSETGVNGRAIYGLREHKIEDGDTLEKMAARYLGDPARADEIFELNQNILSSKEELPIGLILRIPSREW
ncbi:MAG: hypothetical protein K6C40_13455 [Thermoguttaceae bacterium]|nr:hypothetical protein [Thermoguttaceae bacterium]